MAASLCAVVNVLLVLVCAPMIASGHLPQVCDPSQTEPLSKPFPCLPQQFSTTIEANIFRKEVEISVRDYFDEIANRGRMEISRNGSFSYAVFDYDSEQVFMLPDFFSESEEDCVVRKIAEENDFVKVTFGFTLQNDSVHIGTASDFFSLANSSTVKYIGNNESIRGIPCDHWQSCYSSNSSSYIIDYYFSRTDANWTSAYRDDPVPVQIVLDGVKEFGEEVHNVTNIYSFIAFNAGPDAVPDDVFKIPTGVSCKDRISGQTLPILPDFFSTYIESVREETQTVRVAREFYDLEAQLFRADYYSDGQFDLPTGPFTYIQDFNLETQYTINRQLQNCSINPIKPERSFDAVVEDGVAKLASPSEYLLLSNEFNYSYEGVSTVRGVEVESWISYREFEELATVNLTNTIYEIFFTKPGWKLETLTSADSADSTLWRLKLTGTITFVNSSTNLTQTQNFSSTYDFFGFSSGAPDLDVFDTSVCFPPSEYYIVTMYLPVQNVQVDFSQLRRNVRSSVSSFTNVRPLQIGNIQVDGSNSTALYLSLHISNLSSVSVPQGKPVTAKQAIEKLKSGAGKDNKLGFKIEVSPGQYSSPYLIHIRTENKTVYLPDDSSQNESENNSGLSDGGIAAISVLLLILGIALGVVGTLLALYILHCMRSKSTGKASAVSYKKQVDDENTENIVT